MHNHDFTILVASSTVTARHRHHDASGTRPLQAPAARKCRLADWSSRPGCCIQWLYRTPPSFLGARPGGIWRRVCHRDSASGSGRLRLGERARLLAYQSVGRPQRFWPLLAGRLCTRGPGLGGRPVTPGRRRTHLWIAIPLALSLSEAGRPGCRLVPAVPAGRAPGRAGLRASASASSLPVPLAAATGSGAWPVARQPPSESGPGRLRPLCAGNAPAP